MDKTEMRKFLWGDAADPEQALDHLKSIVSDDDAPVSDDAAALGVAMATAARGDIRVYMPAGLRRRKTGKRNSGVRRLE